MDLTIFKISFIPITIFDILDILVVSVVFYELFILMRGTRGGQMMIGLLLLVVISLAAQWLRMEGVSWLAKRVQTVWVIAFVILFQPELRRILIHLGQSRVVRLFYKGSQNRVLEEIVKSATTLSNKGYGALIVITRDTGIAGIIETGVRIRAEVNEQLLVSIFTPKSPLHDGAVVIQGEILEAAKCILPLSQNPFLDPSLGTRHRAALGLSEESDAVIVVVSEETGDISIAVDGKLRRKLTSEELREELAELFGMGFREATLTQDQALFPRELAKRRRS